MTLLTAAEARRTVTDLPSTPRDPWCYWFDTVRREWLYVGRPASPCGVDNL